jgi:hypothetical protein
LYGPLAREKKTLCTMQFGNRTFVLQVDAVGTVCIVVPTYVLCPKVDTATTSENTSRWPARQHTTSQKAQCPKGRDADTPLVHSSLKMTLYQANYINALAVSVLPFFEPAKPMTLDGFFVTLGGFFMTLGEPFVLPFRVFSM